MISVDIVIVDRFPVLSLSLVTEPLRIANRESLSQVFTWRIRTPGGVPVTSSSGIEIATRPLGDQRADIVLLLASYSPEKAVTRELVSWLRRADRAGSLLGCVETGALIFAEAGLLAERPAAAHFEAINAFAAAYPRAAFIDRLYDFSPPRCSSAGGVATFDMTLALIGYYCGRRMQMRVAEVLNYLPTGHRAEQQRLIPDHVRHSVNPVVARAVEIMVSNQRSPVSIADICDYCGVEGSRLQRLFHRHLHRSPSDYYRRLRLERGREMLRNSHLPVAEVAVLCGFENPESFSRAYRRRYGLPPTKDR